MTEFTLHGTVKPFTGNGRKLGFPTANIETAIDTEEGLFIGYVDLKGDVLPALIFIGAPISFDDNIKRAEAHILDFEDVDLYGEKVKFFIKEKLRDNQRFDDIDDLIVQMNIDEGHAREYFKENPK